MQNFTRILQLNAYFFAIRRYTVCDARAGASKRLRPKKIPFFLFAESPARAALHPFCAHLFLVLLNFHKLIIYLISEWYIMVKYGRIALILQCHGKNITTKRRL